MDNGWQRSATAWIADMGDAGDFGRRYVLDAPMLTRALACSPRTALDVGCGEGRFCRLLRSHGVKVLGVDPTPALIETAAVRDQPGHYVRSSAEWLPFRDLTFDLVVCYLSLIDIPDIHAAISEIARVLRVGGTLLIANLNGFNTAAVDPGWIKDARGRRLHYAIDHYLKERAMWVEYRGIRIMNHHRPMKTYFQTLLATGFTLTHFDEPEPSSDAPPDRAERYRRVPWFHVMAWQKSPGAGPVT